MPEALDLMDKSFFNVVADGSKLLEEDFAMGIFSQITARIKPFSDYLDFMINQKQSHRVGGTHKEEDKVLP